MRWNRVESSGIKQNKVEQNEIKWNICGIKQNVVTYKWDKVERSRINCYQVKLGRIKQNKIEESRMKWNTVK